MKRFKIAIIAALAAVVMLCLGIAAGCGGDNDPSELVDNRTVVINPETLVLQPGKTEKLTAKFSVGKGKFEWTSSDETIVSVDENGNVHGVALGTASITATCGEKQGTCSVTVSLPDGYPIFRNGDQSAELFVGEVWNIDSTVTFNGDVVPAKIEYDVLDATTTLYNAKQELANARYNYLINQLNIKSALGTLNEQDLLALNNALSKPVSTNPENVAPQTPEQNAIADGYAPDSPAPVVQQTSARTTTSNGHNPFRN